MEDTIQEGQCLKNPEREAECEDCYDIDCERSEGYEEEDDG